MNVDNVRPALKTRAKGLDHISRGKLKAARSMLFYGEPKVGKTTLASGAPDPVFISADGGADEFDVARLPKPENFEHLKELVADVAERGKSKGFKTLVVDPINWIEDLIHSDVTGGKKSIQSWGGGFNRGPDAAFDRWRQLVALLERVRQAGIHVVLLAHSTVKSFNDPQGPAYDRYRLEFANQRAAGLLMQWVGGVFFCKRESFGKVDSANGERPKAYGSGAHLIYTKWSPAYDAGGRWDVPAELPMSWRAVWSAIEANDSRAEELVGEIDAALVELADAGVETKVRGYIEEAKGNAGRLTEILNAVSMKLKAKEADGVGGDPVAEKEGV